jgi:CheY-like chemotaxis protein
VLDLNEVISGLESMLRRILGERVAFSLAPSREPAWVAVDPGQLEQVLVNLAMNARDAMPGGGAFSVATTLVTLDETHAGLLAGIRPGPCVLLAVSDTGTGMDAATLARIFEPFFTTKEKGKGSGLGLSSVHGIVRQSGGDLSVDSEPGRGATFRIFLPRADAGETEPASSVAGAPAPLAENEGPAGRAGARVLLVEDESAVGRIVDRILREAGYRVHLVSSGVDALLLGEGLAAFDLLLTDVMMPGMNGFELSARLTERYPTLRTLFLSGHADEITLQDRGPSPASHLLRKPFTAAQLTRRVREVLDGE